MYTGTEFVSNLSSTVNDLTRPDGSVSGVQASMRRLETFVFANRRLNVESIPGFGNLAASSRPLYEKREVTLEQALADDIVGSELTPNQALGRFQEFPPIRRTFNYSRLEADAMGLSSESQFVHVGCGGLPETLVGVYQSSENGIKLTGVDMDQQAVHQGKALIERVGLSDKIQIVQAHGAEVDYSEFSDVLVAVLVRPEEETVAQICETASVDKPVTVGLRRALGVAQIIYDDISDRSVQILKSHGFEHTDRVSGHAVVETDLYRRGH